MLRYAEQMQRQESPKRYSAEGWKVFTTLFHPNYSQHQPPCSEHNHIGTKRLESVAFTEAQENPHNRVVICCGEADAILGDKENDSALVLFSPCTPEKQILQSVAGLR